MSQARSRRRRVRPHRRVTQLSLGASIAATALAVTGGTASASGPCGSTGTFAGSNPFTCTYSVVGSDAFLVPSDVTAASFDVIGAVGGNFFVDGDSLQTDPLGILVGAGGGGGGEAAGGLTIPPGSVVQVDVAGAGANSTALHRTGGMGNGIWGAVLAPGGFGGSNGGVPGGPGDASGGDGGTAHNGGDGGGGGGASDVRVGPAGCASLTCPLSDVVFVGAGGGGVGGNGGSGGAPGGHGGAAGGLDGVNGSNGGGGNWAPFGYGATQTAGGAGGLNIGLHTAGANTSDPRYGGDGASGASGSGGAGGHGNLPCFGMTNLNPPCTGGANSGVGLSGGAAGGGGGGGYFGGGGGAGGGGLFGGNGGAGGGGGGGSSFVIPSATNPVLNTNANLNQSFVAGPTAGPDHYVTAGSVNGGNGQVTVTWTAPQTTASCSVTLTRLPGANGPATEAVTISDPNALASIARIVTKNAKVFVGSASGTRIDPDGTSLTSFPTSVVVTAVSTTRGMITPWTLDVTNAEGHTSHCVITPPEEA